MALTLIRPTNDPLSLEGEGEGVKLLALLTRNRAITDILTTKAAVPVNIRHQRVGAFLRFCHGMAQRGRT